MVIDPISNYISNIKNAAVSGKETIVFPYSNLKMAITDVLEKEGYVTNLTKRSKKPIMQVEVGLVYVNGSPKLKGVQRVSKPSKRIYRGANRFEAVKNGFGSLIVSTPKGVMSGKAARKENLGGEVLFKIW